MIGGAFFIDNEKYYIVHRNPNKVIRKPKSKYPKNTELYNLLYSKNIDESHSALFDVIITAYNYFKIHSIILFHYGKGLGYHKGTSRTYGFPDDNYEDDVLEDDI